MARMKKCKETRRMGKTENNILVQYTARIVGGYFPAREGDRTASVPQWCGTLWFCLISCWKAWPQWFFRWNVVPLDLCAGKVGR